MGSAGGVRVAKGECEGSREVVDGGVGGVDPADLRERIPLKPGHCVGYLVFVRGELGRVHLAFVGEGVDECIEILLGAILHGWVGDGDRAGSASGVSERRESFDRSSILSKEILPRGYLCLESVDGVPCLSEGGVVIDEGIVEGGGVICQHNLLMGQDGVMVNCYL